MGFLRQEYWSGLPFPPAGDFPSSGTEPLFPALTDGFFTAEPPGKPIRVMLTTWSELINTLSPFLFFFVSEKRL